MDSTAKRLSKRGIRRCALTLFLLYFALPTYAQVGAWTAHTSMREVLSVDVSDSLAWAGTSGGVFSFDPATGQIETFTVVDGMHSVSASNIAYDRRREVLWIGYNDGVIDRLDPETGIIQSFRDIERATQFPSRRINRLRVHGDTLYAATDFGLVVFDAIRAEVRAAYTRLGSFSPAIPVYDFDLAQLDDGFPGIWVACEEGIAFAHSAAINLQDPAVWTSESTSGDGRVRAITSFGDSVYVGFDDGLRVRQAPGVLVRRGGFTQAVTTLLRLSDRVLGVSDLALFQISTTGAVVLTGTAGASFLSSVVIADDQTLWVGDLAAGLGHYANGPVDLFEFPQLGIHRPEGPRDGLFSSVSVGSDGSLLFGGVPGAGRGFYHLAPAGTWTNYSNVDYPALGLRASFTQVNIDDDGALWAGSEGGGIARVDPSGLVERFDDTNSTLLPVSTTQDFIIVGGVDEDAANNAWVTTYGSQFPMHVRSPDGSWAGLPPYVGQGLTSSSNAYGQIFVDSFDQKWIILRNETSYSAVRGLLVVDTGADIADPGDDAFRFFGSVGGNGQGLPSTTVTAVVEDRNGLVWIGTDRGLAYAVNTGFVARDDNAVVVWPQQADRTLGPYLLFGLPITSLAVDPANRLWVGTGEGVRIVESTEGGFREIEPALTTDNAPLPSNAIVALGVEPTSGRVFVVTNAGLVATQGEAIEPVVEISNLFIYPNPADYTAGDPEIFIEGLAEESVVTIVSAAGAMIRRLEARGGRIRWDGRDTRGATVPSGMYVVVAVGANGEGTGYGKVAVIR